MMDQVLFSMLEQYECVTDDDFENALKQIMQQIALLGLWRAKFFEHAAFYGGTALRILYNLDRFSEDLDFSLLNKNPDFSLATYLNAIQQELNAFGFDTDIAIKEKNIESAIQSAFLKANTQQHLIHINTPQAIQERCHSRKMLKIKLEVDTNPPLGFTTETVALFQPIPFWVKTYTLADLFAGKIAAILCRQWQKRIKGRDWYDFLWFTQRNACVNLHHLEQRLREYGFYTSNDPLTDGAVKEMLTARFQSSSVELAVEDIKKFIKTPARLDTWSTDLFVAATKQLKTESDG